MALALGKNVVDLLLVAVCLLWQLRNLNIYKVAPTRYYKVVSHQFSSACYFVGSSFNLLSGKIKNKKKGLAYVRCWLRLCKRQHLHLNHMIKLHRSLMIQSWRSKRMRTCNYLQVKLCIFKMKRIRGDTGPQHNNMEQGTEINNCNCCCSLSFYLCIYFICNESCFAR